MHYDGGQISYLFFEWSCAFHCSFYASRCTEDPEKEKEVNLVTCNFFTSCEEVNIRVGFHLQSMLILAANIY